MQAAARPSKTGTIASPTRAPGAAPTAPRVRDFATPPSGFAIEWDIRPIYDFHSFKVLPRLGRLFANDADSYQYLAESIRKHPPQDELRAMMAAAGFERTDYRNLSGGIVAIHSGYKL